MGKQSFKKLVETSDDKFSIFMDKNTLAESNISVADFLDLINIFLDDEQKALLVESEHINNSSSYIKTSIISSISDDTIKLGLLSNSNITSDFENWHIKDLIESLNENSKMQILLDSNFIDKYKMEGYEISDIISRFTDENKLYLLSNRSLIEEQLQLKDFKIATIISSLQNEESKLNMIDNYSFSKYIIKDIINTFSDDSIKNVVLENKYDFNNYDMTSLISSMDVNFISDFISENKEFLLQNDISPYNIVNYFDTEKQLNFMEKLEDSSLSLRRKETNSSDLQH